MAQNACGEDNPVAKVMKVIAIIVNRVALAAIDKFLSSIILSHSPSVFMKYPISQSPHRAPV